MAHESAKPLYRGTQIVWYIASVVEALLAFRFILKLIGANPGAGFTDFIYTVSYPLMRPFLFVVKSPNVFGSVIEWTTILAMVVYWILAWGIVRLFVMGKPVSTAEADYKLGQQDSTNRE